MSFGRASKGEPLEGRRLKERALDLLSRRDHSEVELFRKLREKGGVESEISELIHQFRDFGYLDDRRFCQNFVRFRSGKMWGRKRYHQELRQRGVDGEIVDSVLDSLDEVRSEALKEKLRPYLVREIEKEKPKEKIFSSLARRGFSLGMVRNIYDSLITESVSDS